MERGNRWSDRWIDRHREERGRMNVCVCVCGCVRARAHVAWLAKERDTRCPREREETNCLHYANAVQLQLTVAKNRCRYRGMLTRTSRGFLSSPRSVFLVPLWPSFYFILFIRSTLRLFLDSEDSPALSWNEMVPRMKIESHFSYSYFTPLKIFSPPSHSGRFRLAVDFFLFVWKPRSLASPLPRSTMLLRGKLPFQKAMISYVMILVFQGRCEDHWSASLNASLLNLSMITRAIKTVR